MTQADETQIRDLIKNWERSVNAKDINGVLAGHSNDILLFDVVEPIQSKGIDAYKVSWEQQFFPWYGDDGAFKIDELKVFAGNDIAFCHGFIYCSGTEKGQKVSLKIRLTVGLKKINGEWVVVHEHHSETAK
jgi:ketosteroid isomerase-like protein